MRFLRREIIQVPAGPNTFFPYVNFGAHAAHIKAFTAGSNKRVRVFDNNQAFTISALVGDFMPITGVEDAPPWCLVPLAGGSLQFSPIDGAAFVMDVDFYDAPPAPPSGTWIAHGGSETFPPGAGTDSIILTLGDFGTIAHLAIQCTATGGASIRPGDANTFAFVSQGFFLNNPGGGTVESNVQITKETPARFFTLDLSQTDIALPNTFTWLWRVACP